MLFGFNILDLASTIIEFQTVDYYQDSGTTLNVIGQDLTSYETVTQIVGSFQPVPKSLYYTYELDLQKSYFTFYTSNNILDVQRDISGDQIAFNGRVYQVESANDWFATNGWKGVLVVYIGARS